MTQTIFDFNINSDLKNWYIVNDDVMGGVSKCDFFIDKNGNGVFEGTISTLYNGGFSSVRYAKSKISTTDKSKIVLKIKGDKKKYQLRIKANKSDYQSYIYYFETSGEWETIVIPINDMYASFRGRRLYMKNYDNTFFEELSILAGNKKNENFKLLINNIYLQ